VALFFIYINYRGASETGKIGAFFTLGQMLFLAVIGIMGAVVVIKDPSRFQNFQPFLPAGWSKLLVTMGFTYVAFEGFEVISQAGDETIDPRRNLPKAILYSVLTVTLVYVSVAFATVVAVKEVPAGFEGAAWQWIGSFKE
jgi:APA family basic amino acid/polyamine antiporter